jgi:pilus assembly protein CpaE
MTLELTAIKNTKQFLELGSLLGYPEDKLMLVLNKADPRLGIRVQNIEGQIRRKVATQIGNAAHDMTLSLNQGVPLVIDQRNHQVTKDILALAALTVQSLAPGELTAAASATTIKSGPATTGTARPVPAARRWFGWLLPKR